ncbi:BTB/POZ domain-containing protein 17-like [Tubulanus polymorphus]|uniref:BTB/POZ domain-containing protein 17-like n=1 Tax=Tubulanus polymorphus TaxID=672921 RepID=UPI003DA21AE3
MVCTSSDCLLHQRRRVKLDPDCGKDGSCCRGPQTSICNGSAIIDKLTSLYAEREFCDIELTVTGVDQIFYAHKLILSLSSPVFKAMLTPRSHWSESSSDRITLEEDPICRDSFDSFLRYLYSGRVDLDCDSALPMLMLADKYQVSDLSTICIEYMIERVAPDRALLWYRYTAASVHAELHDICKKSVAWNFDTVLASSDFLALDADSLAEFLAHSNIVVRDEFTVFEGVQRWVRANRAKNTTTRRLTSLIRFPMIPARRLPRLLESENRVESYILEKMEESRRFHAVPPPVKWGRCAAKYMFVPRNYTDELWCATLMIHRFSELDSNVVRGFMFATPISASAADASRSWDWNVNVYPKGIRFAAGMMIGATRNYEIAETIYETVRISVVANGDEVRSVNLVMVIYGRGIETGSEFVRHVVQRRCTFDSSSSCCVIDDLIPYRELNCDRSRYLCGADSDTFKISIIVKPV